MKKIITLSILFLLTASAHAQTKRNKPKNTDQKGALYFYWGYNRSAYTKTNLHFTGPGYDFTFEGAKARDRQEKQFITYVNPATLTIPQFNMRLGYNFWKHYSISLGWDHMKYIMNDDQTVSLNGNIDPGVDPYWSGNYSHVPTFLAHDHIHYENSNGMNFIRVQAARNDQWYQTRKNGWFGVSTIFGISGGMILSFNDWHFGGTNTIATVSLSGYGFAANAGLRLTFFKHIFLQTNIAGGFVHQVHVKTRPNGPDYAQQKLGYIASETVFGVMFYIRTKNDCNTCPKW